MELCVSSSEAESIAQSGSLACLVRFDLRGRETNRVTGQEDDLYSLKPMSSFSFPLSRVNRLRRSAARARGLPPPSERPGQPSGWVASPYDANKLVGVFDTLRLKAGFALHAYEYRSGGDGNGIIWAVPADAPLIPPEDCPKLEDMFLSPPRPLEAVPLMQAIEGDGSPWSYLSASILCREAGEFAASWHGARWTSQTIFSKAPRQGETRSRLDDPWELGEDAPLGDWTWEHTAPSSWEPSFVESGATRKVVLHIHDMLGGEVVYRATDTYASGSYDCETTTTVLCTGRRAFVY